jgi:septum formation protein
MRHVGFSFDTVVPNVNEDAVPTSMDPVSYVEHLARLKAETATTMIDGDAIVIGSDTTVVLDGAVLNKPSDANDAHRMLRLLSGQTHTVYTGLALICSYNGRSYQRISSRATHVTFRELTEQEIHAYVESGSPLDKAGAYGIQDDFGAMFVYRVDGCYYTIVGLPLELLYTELRNLVGEMS